MIRVSDSRQAGASEVTPAMIERGRHEWRRWMLRWDYLSDGVPADAEVDALLSSIFSAMAEVMRPLDSTREQPWIGHKDVTGKSSLHMIYPNWIGWGALTAIGIVLSGAVALAYSLVFVVFEALAAGLIVVTFGLLMLLVIVAAAERCKLVSTGGR